MNSYFSEIRKISLTALAYTFQQVNSTPKAPAQTVTTQLFQWLELRKL